MSRHGMAALEHGDATAKKWHGWNKSKTTTVVAKLITRLTGAARPLSMSWHNRDFVGEQDVSKMLRCFATSSLVRRSLPNAASTMSEYFSFRRRPNEPIAQFLVREALGFEEFQ